MSAQIGKRHVFPLINVICERILTNPERLEWFKDQGMPVNDHIMAFEGMVASSYDWALFSGKPEYAAFMEWVEKSGKFVYASYLVTHPGYTLSAETVYMSTGPILEDAPPTIPMKLAGQVYTTGRWNLNTLLAISVVGLALFFKRKLGTIFVLPAILVSWLLVSLFFIFHADSMEVMRHSLMIPVAVRVILLFTVLLFADAAWQRVSRGSYALSIESDGPAATIDEASYPTTESEPGVVAEPS
jgi:hypothetical protein